VCAELTFKDSKRIIYVEFLILTFFTVSNYNYIYGFAKPAVDRRMRRNDETVALADRPQSAMTNQQLESVVYSGTFEPSNIRSNDDFDDVFMPETKSQLNIELDDKARGSRMQLQRRKKNEKDDSADHGHRYREDSEGNEDVPQKLPVKQNLEWE
jgi:hypothetical protein